MNHPLDSFVPTFDVRERHSVLVRAPAATVFAVARSFDLQSIAAIRGIIGLRGFLLHTTPVERQPQPFLREAIAMGWGILAEDPGRLFVAGARCQPWLGNVVFTPLPPGEFAAYPEPGQVKIAWTLEVESLGTALSRLATETRAVATDDVSRERFRRYWRWARFGIVAIRWLMLPTIRRQAERAASSVVPPER